MKTDYYLVHLRGLTEPSQHGPYHSLYFMQKALLDLVGNEKGLQGEGEDLVYFLMIIDGTPYHHTFSGGYLDHIREIVQAHKEKRKPSDEYAAFRLYSPMD